MGADHAIRPQGRQRQVRQRSSGAGRLLVSAGIPRKLLQPQLKVADLIQQNAFNG